MAKERKASVIYEGNASQLVYAFPFDYLRKKFVKVEDIYTNITELTMGADYTVEDKQVRLVKGIPLGHFVKIYRETTTAPLVEWQDASVLRSADLSLQEVQLLHLAEEALDMAQDKGLTTDDNDGVWDARYNKIKNLLEPTEAGDAVNLGYITKNQDSLLNKLNSTGATQNKSIVATGDAQNARLIATGEAQNTRLLATGDNKNKTLEDTGDAQNERLIATGNEQNTRLTVTGTYQNKIVTDTGRDYVGTMTTLKDTVVNKANEVNTSVELAKKWAMSPSSPDGVDGNKSSKTWSEEAKAAVSTIAAHAASAKASELASASSEAKAAKSASAAKNSETASAISATEASHSATEAANSLSQTETHEANAAASVTAARIAAVEAQKHAENASKYDATNALTGKETLGYASEGNLHTISIPLARGMYPLVGYPDGFDSTTNLFPYSFIANLQGIEGGADAGTILSFFAQNTKKDLYYRVGWSGSKWNTDWQKIATTEYVDSLKPSMLIDDMAFWDYLHRFKQDPDLPTTNVELNKLGVFSSFFTTNKIKNQPTTYGQLINIPASATEATQLWIAQISGQMYHRGGNNNYVINDRPFIRFLDEDDLKAINAKIPTKLGQLTNDANYATTPDVETAVEASEKTIKAQIPKATSQLTDDVGYATTASVNEKIDNVWDTPLDWDTLESGTVRDGTTIIYDSTNIPWRLRYDELFYEFKKDLPFSDYVLKTDYSQEAKKWKDAYNNLRKRSTPTAFDDDELTVLMNTPIGRGTIILSQPYTDFDGLLIDFSDDDGALLNSKYISTAELNRRIARAKDIGISSIFLLSEYYYWTIWITERSGFSTTTFPNRGENCQIKCIYGVKLKEIT